MRSISARAWLLVVLSAGLQVFMFPTGGPMPLWRTGLCWFALAPLLLALTLPDRDGAPLKLKQSLLLGYFCGILWYFGNCFWIYQTMYLYGGLPKPVSLAIVVLFSLYLGLYHALFAGLFSLLRRANGGAPWSLILTPFLWVAVELARGQITGFPWDLLGNVLVDNLLVTRLAPVLGVMGISFVVVAANSWFALAFVRKGRTRWALLAVTLLLVFCLQAGYVSRSFQHEFAPTDTAVLLQENLLVGATGREVQPVAVAEELEQFAGASSAPRSVHFTGDTASFAQAGVPLARPDLIVWPEAPSHFQSGDEAFRDRLATLAKENKTPLIVGSLGVDLDRTSARGYYLYDSATIFNAAGSYAGRYDKIHLVPWGEYIPFKKLFAFAQKLTEGAGDMDAGRQRKVFDIDGHRYGVFICYESIFGSEVREFADRGAEVLVNISDDGWYGETGAPWQHLNMARMRAIENRRWVLRSTNTGVTTAIDPLGRVELEAPRHVRAAFAFPFGFVQQTTFYTRHGDWFAWLCALVTVLAVAGSRRFQVPLRPHV